MIRSRYAASDTIEKTVEKAEDRINKKLSVGYHATKSEIQGDLIVLGMARKLIELQRKHSP